MLDNCPQLHTLDVSRLPSAATDSFLADLCERALELRRLGLYVGPHNRTCGPHGPRKLTSKPSGPQKQLGAGQKAASVDLLVAVVRACPSLAQLCLTLPTTGGKTESAGGDWADEVVDAVRLYHGGLCHRRDASPLSDNCHQIQLTFTPLKLLTAVASCPYLAE